MNGNHADLDSLTERVINLERTLNSFLIKELDAPITLAANRFVLRDSNGVERGLISAPDESSAAILLLDSKGTTQLFAGVEQQGPTIALYDAKETPRVKLTVNELTNGSAISLHDSNGTTQISIVSLEGEPVRMSIHDSNGTRRADLLYVEDNDDVRGAALTLKDSRGKVRVMVSDTCVAVLDSDGKVIFYAPETSGKKVPPPSQLLLYKKGQQHGPYSVEQVKAWIATGQIQAMDQVWYEGASGWATVASIPWLTEE